MVLSFWKKKALAFSKNEEVEVSLKRQEDSLPEVFITTIAGQSPHRIHLHLPLPRKEAVKAGDAIIIHVRRERQLGSFKSTVADVSGDEIPPTFSIKSPGNVFWEEIVPGRLATKENVHARDRKTPVQALYENREFDVIPGQVKERELTFSGNVRCLAGTSLILAFNLPGKSITCEAPILNCSLEEGGFSTTVSLGTLKDEDLAMILEFFGGAG